MAGRALTILAIVVILGAALGVYLINKTPTARDDEQAARAFIEAFGRKLQNVSLTADRTMVADAMSREYGPFVAPALLTEWQNDPTVAPGRLTTSPWPDRIEIANVEKKGAGYEMQGHVVEVTSEGGGIGEQPTEAVRRPISLTVEKSGSNWRIVMLTLGSYPGDGNWVLSTTTSQGIQFMYPERLPTTFISTQGWPPKVVLEGGIFSCSEREEKMVGDRVYCMSTTNEGVAGSTYTTYKYATEQGDLIARVEFTLKFPQCVNYDEPNQSACKAEQANFDIDGLVDRITSSIRML